MMQMNESRPAPKSGKAVIFIVILVILAAVIYAAAKKPGGNKKTGLENQLELTEENLIAVWVRETEDMRYELLFDYGNHMIFAGYKEGERSPSLISIKGSYSVSENVISAAYTIDMQEYSGRYGAQLSEEYLVLTQLDEGEWQLAGTYRRLEDDATMGTSSSQETGDDENTESTPEGTSEDEADTADEPSVTDETSEAGESSDPVQSVSDDSWKEAYKNYIKSQPDEDWTYRLIYLNDDDIPELYMQGVYMGLGGKLCTYSDGSIVPLKINAVSISYVERGGVILDTGGSMGSYYDKVYSLENGELVLKFDGFYGVDDNTVPFDEGDFKYKINGSPVSKSEYEQKLGGIFSSAAAQMCDAKFSKSQIIYLIDDQ